MTPGPSLEEMIATVKADAASDDARDQLAAASKAVADLEATADAVLAHFVDQCRRSGRSWSEISAALGVSKQAAHKRFSLVTPTLERFTARARSALSAATDAARALGHGYVGTEHLLVGLFEPAGGIAAACSTKRGSRARWWKRRSSSPRRARRRASRTLRSRRRAVAAIERAVTEALGMRHNYVGTEHLLLALFGDDEDLAAKILTDLGARPDDYRDRIVEKLSGYTKP